VVLLKVTASSDQLLSSLCVCMTKAVLLLPDYTHSKSNGQTFVKYEAMIREITVW